ncbi:MAG: DNA primase [Chitinophagaceae bacterium]
MLLSEVSIQQVRDVSVTDVVGHYVKLTKRGASHTGLCPFHNEKTPSFHVTEAKGIFKCFGCGAAGDAIEFVMRHDKLDFITAVETIGARCHIAMQYEEVPDKEKYEQEKAFKDQLKTVLQFTNDQYKKNLWELPGEDPVTKYLANRGITKEVIADWQLGWATIDWRHIAPQIINRDMFAPAERLGIVKRAKDVEKNYDGYRSRITIPITNRLGECIGLAGRYIEIDPADKGRDTAKYINPPENEIYSKSQVLFGLSRAIKAIERHSFAFLVEGYFDVISMHQNDDDNTVGKCGTAFTQQQASLLKKYTNHVVIVGDGDDAGRAATIKDLMISVKAGFQTEVALLPTGEDPDSWIQKHKEQKFVGTVEILDGIPWYIDSLLTNINKEDHYKLGKAKEAIVKFLSLIPNDLIRNNYFDNIIKKYKWQKNDLQKQLVSILEESAERQETEDDGMTNLDRMPKWMDKEQFLRDGYCAVNNGKRTGYYTFSASGQVEISNFIINPLFHIRDGLESRHLIQIDNGRKKAVLDIESKALISIDLLNAHLIGEGPFIFYGTKPQILRIATTLLARFPLCIPVKFLGWQRPGFFSFVDKVYIPGEGIRELDEWGILKFADRNHIVPAASAAYKEMKSSGNDPYENHRVLTYKESAIQFEQWAGKMYRVYKEKGPVAIAYVILTLFRDIVFDIDNNCPHLYGFGERSSGKSKWAESICAVFYTKRSAYNLNSGTDFAFFDYMQRFVNCPSQLNEFDEKVIKPEWFQSIKGAFDGESRQRGVMGNRSRVEIMKIESTLILTGQYMCTMDDNSIVSRSIIEPFSERDVTDEEKKMYDDLKATEEKGLSNILVEIIKHRAFIKENYRIAFNKTLGEWRRSIDGDTQNFNQRIMQNWCHLYTGWQLMSQKITMPISNQKFEDYCKQKGIKWSSFIRTSDTLSEFWNTLSFLAEMGTIIEGWDYKIKTLSTIRLRNSQHVEVDIPFNEPTKVIYIRMNNVHKHYQQAYRTRTGKEGMTMENLQHYFSSRKYYLGNSKQSQFRRFVTETQNVPKQTGFNTSEMVPEVKRVEQAKITSSFVFLYDQLNLDLEKEPLEDGQIDLSGISRQGGIDFSKYENKEPEITEPADDVPF